MVSAHLYHATMSTLCRSLHARGCTCGAAAFALCSSGSVGGAWFGLLDTNSKQQLERQHCCNSICLISSSMLHLLAMVVWQAQVADVTIFIVMVEV